MKFSIKDFFSKCDQIRMFLNIMQNIFRIGNLTQHFHLEKTVKIKKKNSENVKLFGLYLVIF